MSGSKKPKTIRSLQKVSGSNPNNINSFSFRAVYNGTAKLSNPDHLVNHNFRKMPLKQYFT